jgi:hypothetical protein
MPPPDQVAHNIADLGEGHGHRVLGWSARGARSSSSPCRQPSVGHRTTPSAIGLPDRSCSTSARSGWTGPPPTRMIACREPVPVRLTGTAESRSRLLSTLRSSSGAVEEPAPGPGSVSVARVRHGCKLPQTSACAAPRAGAAEGVAFLVVGEATGRIRRVRTALGRISVRGLGFRWVGVGCVALSVAVRPTTIAEMLSSSRSRCARRAGSRPRRRCRTGLARAPARVGLTPIRRGRFGRTVAA